MGKHTPGPWITDGERFVQHVPEGCRSIFASTIADVRYRRSCDERKANACLIAAAPEIYELLKGICEELHDSILADGPDAPAWQVNYNNEIVALIAKIEGVHDASRD